MDTPQQDIEDYILQDLQFEQCSYPQTEYSHHFKQQQMDFTNDKLQPKNKQRKKRQRRNQMQSANVPTVLPRYSQIQKSLQTLRLIVPQLFPDRFVDEIFTLSCQRLAQSNPPNTITSKSVKRHRTKKINQNNLQMANSFCSNLDLSKKEEQVQKQFIKLQSNQDHSQYVDSGPVNVVKVIAQIFCKYGNKKDLLYQAVRQIAAKIQSHVANYQQILEKIVFDAYQKLQSFLIEECHQLIPSLLQNYDKDALLPILVNCQQKFPSHVCQSFLDIIRVQNGILDIKITDDMVKPFYDAVFNALNQLQQGQVKESNKKEKRLKKNNLPYPPNLSQSTASTFTNSVHVFKKRNRLKRRITPDQGGTKQLMQIKRMNRIWNHRYEMQLVKSYKNYKAIADIKSHFQQIFPQNKDMFTVSALRSKLYKILRSAIRKLYSFICQDDVAKKLPQMGKLDHNEIRWIIYNNEGFHVRLLLINVFQSSHFDQRLLTQTINAITKYVEELNKNYKLSQVIDQCSRNKSDSIKQKPMTTKN